MAFHSATSIHMPEKEFCSCCRIYLLTLFKSDKLVTFVWYSYETDPEVRVSMSLQYGATMYFSVLDSLKGDGVSKDITL